jgi:protein TonB
MLYYFFHALIVFRKKIIRTKKKNPINTIPLKKKPEFPGGMEAFFKYIGNNYKTPKVSNLSGKIYLNFVIEKDGSIVEVKVLRDLGYGTGEEAVRVLSESPKWSPGMQNGQPVRVMFNLPISIQSSR